MSGVGEAAVGFVKGSVALVLVGFVGIAILSTLQPSIPSSGPFTGAWQSVVRGFGTAIIIAGAGGTVIFLLRLRNSL